MSRVVGSLDTNVLLRLLLQDVPKQHAAAVALLGSADGQFAVADVAIIELVFVLGRGYDFSRDQIASVLAGIVQLKQITCNRALLERVVPYFVKHPKLSFEDCCLASYAALNGAEPLWTFDKKLAMQRPGAAQL